MKGAPVRGCMGGGEVGGQGGLPGVDSTSSPPGTPRPKEMQCQRALV